MIDLVDQALKTLLERELAENPTWKAQLPQVVFGLPRSDAPQDDLARIYLYLHDIRENTALRNDDALIRYRGDTRRADPEAGRTRCYANRRPFA